MPDQEEVQELLSKMEHVKQLVQSIKANGGLVDPLIVRDGDYVVFEGNSRLAAYRLLAKKDPIKWAKVKCQILPRDISNDLVFTLLGEYHIIGRKDWVPYEQAGYLYRRIKIHNVKRGDIVKELGLNEGYIQHLYEVYSFMVDNNDANSTHWSYYDEYLKSNIINKKRKEYSTLDKIIVKKIKSGEIEKAVDIRDKLKKICQGTKRVVEGFVSEDCDFEESYKRALDGGVGNKIFETLHRFRIWLADSSIESEINDMKSQVSDKVKFEVKSIYRQISKINDKLNK